MPWVNEERCTGCGVCADICPAGAVHMAPDHTAVIDMHECIRCGECHDGCPNEAVRHDSERAQEIIDDTIETAVRLLEKCGSDKAKLLYLDKRIKSLHLENSINEKSIKKLEAMKKTCNAPGPPRGG